METISHEKSATLDAIAAALVKVPGVEAVVLGGSHAAGYATERSDLDIGIYYTEKAPFNIESIRDIANSFSSNGSALVTGFYEWGPWVNGGVWMESSAGKVDFLYRNIDQVQQVITDASNGIWHHHFDQQPPFGFRSVIYLGETQVCKPLFDPAGVIEGLKKQIAFYPGKLRQTILLDCLWLAEFTLMQCEGFARSADVYNTVGCFTRIANYLVHALFAINEVYPLGDKRALQIIDTLEKVPPGMKDALTNILGQAGTQASALLESADMLKSLWAQIVALSDGRYQPRFTH